MGTILTWLVVHRNKLVKAILGLSVAFLVFFSINVYNKNKKLSESLEMAQNNIEAYQGSLQESWQANNVLKLDIEDLQNQNDKLLNRIDSVAKKLKIKPKQVHTAATQSQVLSVNESKGVQGDLIKILKDTVYNDSIKYNDLTTVHYTIGKDTVSVGIDLQNTQYLYVYSTREYKNKKNFFLRLLTFDFKKVTKYQYRIENTNDLIKTDSVRVIEAK